MGDLGSSRMSPEGNCLRLHRALSQAELEYQGKFDALRDFELNVLLPQFNH